MTLQPSTDQMTDIERILIPQEQIAARVAQLGAEISSDYEGRELVLISVLKGGIVFLADLMRQITVPHEIELVGATSYKGGTVPTPGVRITKDVEQNLAGKHLLMVEDIYDTGNTLHVVHDLLRLHHPASLEICALLRKDKPHLQKLAVRYLGFDIADVFVVGYGLDFKEHYRNLPCLGVLNASLYK